MKQIKNKNVILAVVTALVMVSTLPFLQSCSNEDEIEYKDDVANLIAEYGLKKISTNKINVIEFNTLGEAKAYLEKIKHRKKQKGEITLNLNSSSLGKFSATIKSSRFKSTRMKLPTPEQLGWESRTDVGLFSDLLLEFNTGVDDRDIDQSSISLKTEGIRVGWAYSQTGTTMIDNNSFIIKGTVSWGFGAAGSTLTSDETVNIRIDINWSTGKATWTEL